MSDFSGVTNPKRVIARREAEALAGPKPSAPASGPRFGKQFTPEERQQQQAALVKKLRERQ
jgi:hypothetical protein